MTDSIEKMCNPLDNSINEKLSRIREAFVKNIAEEYAKFYYVSGERGDVKRIRLDKKLVDYFIK
ncbi:hypothetical protein FACS189440_01230 [Bacteroidia bacterium]|nr:hypothetical protein FACS189440_01230 [Bacteroidia bacterium]